MEEAVPSEEELKKSSAKMLEVEVVDLGLQLSQDHTYSVTPLSALKDGKVFPNDHDANNNEEESIIEARQQQQQQQQKQTIQSEQQQPQSDVTSKA